MPSYTLSDKHLVVMAETIGSLTDTMSLDAELIIINDGSTKNIDEIAYSTNTYIRHKENRGIAVSWNDGLRIARGEYLVVVNDDITVSHGWLEALRNALDFDDDYWVAAPGVKGKTQGIGIEEDYQWFPGYCFMMKRDCLSYIGLFDEQFSPYNYEDTDYWTRVLALGKKLVRNYKTTITHKEGDVLHSLDYDNVSYLNREKFLKKWNFDPIPVFYENKPFDFGALKNDTSIIRH